MCAFFEFKFFGAISVRISVLVCKASVIYYILKCCVHYTFACLFFKTKKRALMKLGKVFFILLSKLFIFSRESKFRTSNIQILWRH